MKARSLQDLAPLRQALAERAAHEARLRQQALEAERRERAERNLFRDAVGPVQALAGQHHDRHWALPELPQPLPLQHWLDEERVLRESISDDFDVSTLLDTDDQLSFRRPGVGVGVDVTRRLRAGHWSIQRELDLHGLRTDDAREALATFIREAVKLGLRCVRVVHGKGLGSPGKAPVLKSRVQGWLIQKTEVLAFVQAKPAEGGAGALLVLLQASGNAILNKNR